MGWEVGLTITFQSNSELPEFLALDPIAKVMPHHNDTLEIKNQHTGLGQTTNVHTVVLAKLTAFQKPDVFRATKWKKSGPSSYTLGYDMNNKSTFTVSELTM